MLRAGGGSMMGMGGRASSGSTLKLDDVAAVRNRLAEKAVVAALIMQDDIPIKAGDQSTQTDVMACDPNFPQAFDWYVASGDPIDEDDERSMARVCVLGSTVAKNLFPDQDAVGQRLLVNKVQFTVKGILTSRGTNTMGFDMDDRMWIPLSTGMRRVFHTDSVRTLRINVRRGQGHRRRSRRTSRPSCGRGTASTRARTTTSRSGRPTSSPSASGACPAPPSSWAAPSRPWPSSWAAWSS